MLNIAKIHLKRYAYKITYECINTDGKLGVRITEYDAGKEVLQKDIQNVTKNQAEIDYIINVFRQNKVFAIHAADIIEELRQKK